MINILCIGNSFSEDMIMYIPELACEYEISLEIQCLGYPGGSIDQQIDFLTNKKAEYIYRYYNNKKYRWEYKTNVIGNEVINQKHWDYIMIQECSYGSGQPVGYPRLKEYVSLLKSLFNYEVKILWQMTWPYPSYNQFEFFLRDFNGDERKMYEGIVNNVKNDVLTNKNIFAVIPSGTSIKNAKEITEETSLYRDPVHLSYHRGRFLASLTFMKKMFDIDLTNLETEPMGLNPNLKEQFKLCVENAIKNPFEITK